MNKNKNFINTTRRKFVSGVGLIAAGIALKPLSLFAQDEATKFSLYSPINYLSNKIISLPIYPNLNVTEQNFILKVLKNV